MRLIKTFLRSLQTGLGANSQGARCTREGRREDMEETVVRAKGIASLVGHNPKGRTALVVEALWDEVEPVRDWETLLDVLLLDHSAADEGRPTSRSKGKQAASDEAVDEAYRLEEVEEAVLVEMLVATLRKALADAAAVTAKKVRRLLKLSLAVC